MSHLRDKMLEGVDDAVRGHIIRLWNALPPGLDSVAIANLRRGLRHLRDLHSLVVAEIEEMEEMEGEE